MAGTPEKESERATSSSRPLHNFTLPPRLRWGHQKQLRCARSSQSSSSRKAPATSATHLNTESRFIPISRRSAILTSSPVSPTITSSPVTPPIPGSPVSSPIINKAAVPSNSSRGPSELEAVREKLMSDLKVVVDEHLKHGLVEEKGKGKEVKKPVEETLPWNLRNRRAAGQTTNDSGNGLWPARRSDRVYRSLMSLDKGEGSGDSQQNRNNFSVSLTKSEIDEDFLIMTGQKAPRRPKKRSKPVQRAIDGLFPGSWLSEINAEKYKVPEGRESKQKEK